MSSYCRLIMSVILVLITTGCVTQQYSKEDKQIIQNDVSNREIAMTRISLGLGYLKMGNTTQAKLNLEKAKRYAPNMIEVYTAFAHYYEYVGEPDLAIASYQQALDINKDDANTLNNYGVFLCRQGKVEQAKIQWLKAVKIPTYTQVSESYENLANCQLQHHHFIEAETYLNKAIDHSPSNASALLQMARILYAKQEYFQAEKYIRRYEKSTRRFSAEALAVAFQVYNQQHKQKVAKNYAAMLLKMFPQSYQAKQYLLNELKFTELDKLARQYRDFVYQSKINKASNKKKRVVKLMPNHKMIDVTKKQKTQTPTQLTLTQAEKSTSKTVNKSLAKQATKGLLPTTEKKSISKAPTVKKSLRAKSSENQKLTASDNKTSVNGQVMMTLPVHIVVAGDSLFSLSKKYNVRFSNLLRWNKKTNKSLLHVGDVIYLANPKKAVKK